MAKAYWHIHHEILVEFATEPIRNRIKYIKERKCPEEVETRLRLLKPVKGKLPSAVKEAQKVYEVALTENDKALKTYKRAWQLYGDSPEAKKAHEVYHDAWLVLHDAWNAYQQTCLLPAVLELHAEECPNCPWDGETIFPERREL